MLIDSDILIFAFNGKAKATELLDNTMNKEISVITYMEILQGSRNSIELNKFIKYLIKYHYQILPLNQQIVDIASELVKNYTLSHNMQMADALIASTAIVYEKTLISANAKHYQFIPNLSFQKFTV